jgi:two-component sensor histidine kinase
LARSRSFFDEAGKTEKIMGTIQDITEQKLAEQEIQELNESLEKRVIDRTEQLEKANKEIRALLQEMHHRVKNNLQIVSSLMNLQANSIKEKKYAGIFEESRDRIYAMAIIHENLYLGESVSEINLREYIKPLIEGRIRANQTMDKKLALDLSIPNAYFNIGAVLPLGLLLNELVTNTIKHAFPKGREGLITLSIKNVRGGEYKLEYSDNGIGFEEGGDYQSLGLVLIDSFVMQIDGVLTRKSNSKGTHYTIVFSMES